MRMVGRGLPPEGWPRGFCSLMAGSGSSPPMGFQRSAGSLLSGHGSLRGRREPPHDGVGSPGLVMSGTRSPAPSRVRAATTPTRWPELRPDRDTLPPLPADLVPSRSSVHAAAASLADQRNSLPSRSMRCRMTESFRATATVAFLVPILLANRVPQAFSADQRGARWRMMPAASYR
jgi:hypothetical protein